MNQYHKNQTTSQRTPRVFKSGSYTVEKHVEYLLNESSAPIHKVDLIPVLVQAFPLIPALRLSEKIDAMVQNGTLRMSNYMVSLNRINVG